MPAYTKKANFPGKSASELYEVVARDIERLLQKTPLGDFKIDRDATKKEVSVKSSMFSATLVCTDGELRLDGQLGFLASAFRPKIDEVIDRWLAKTFSKQTG